GSRPAQTPVPGWRMRGRSGRHRAPGTERGEVGPVLLDVVEARLPGVLAVDHAPARRYRQPGRPQGVLLLVVHEDEEGPLGIIEDVHRRLLAIDSPLRPYSVQGGGPTS